MSGLGKFFDTLKTLKIWREQLPVKSKGVTAVYCWIFCVCIIPFYYSLGDSRLEFPIEKNLERNFYFVRLRRICFLSIFKILKHVRLRRMCVFKGKSVSLFFCLKNVYFWLKMPFPRCKQVNNRRWVLRNTFQTDVNFLGLAVMGLGMRNWRLYH